MAVTYGTSGGAAVAASPYSASISPQASRGFLVVFVGWEYTGGATVTSVAYAGHTLERAGLVTDDISQYRMERFWLPHYTEDSGDLVVTMSTGTINFLVYWMAFAGANPTTPIRDGSSNSGNSIHPTNSVGSAVDDLIAQAVVYSSAATWPTPPENGWNSGQSQHVGQNTSGTARMNMAACDGVAGTKILDCTISTTVRWLSEAMSVQPTGGVQRRGSGMSGGMRALLGGMQG